MSKQKSVTKTKGKENRSIYLKIFTCLTIIVILILSVLFFLSLGLIKPSLSDPTINSYGSQSNPISWGNWDTSVGINFGWGAGYYQLASGQVAYFSSLADAEASL